MNSPEPDNTTSELKLSFSSLPLRDELKKSIKSLSYDVMTPIQAQSLPNMLENKDIIAQANTGSGKTVAFGLNLLNKLTVNLLEVQALILCPTRELAEQVSQVLRQLSKFIPNVKVLNLSGGMPMKAQLDSLKYGAHIIVGTPGRLKKHLEKKSLNLANLETLVLDEADRMLDMGFFDDIKSIILLCPKPRQTLLFSATYPDEIKQLALQFMQNPQDIKIETPDNQFDIEQRFYEVPSQTDKYNLLKSLLFYYKPVSTLIFCNTKKQTLFVADMLIHSGFSATALNGDLEQFQREQAMICFSNKSLSILVATDVAARGLDIKELPVVINYELAFENDIHVHRIGRTGRAGNKGLALSITTPVDAQRICIIEENLKKPVSWGNLNELYPIEEINLLPQTITLCLSSGKKDKIRPGDILGALTKDAGMHTSSIGKINITSNHSFVAIHRPDVEKAFRYFQNGKLKGRKVGVKKIILK